MKKSKFRGPESARTNAVIALLEKTARKNKARVWKVVAEFLRKPSRSKKKGVNLFKIDRFARDGELIVVPSVLLGHGSVSKNVHVAAFKASKSAKEKLGAKLLPLEIAVERHATGKNVRIIV